MSMSMQEIFDKVVLHLRTQKVPSIQGESCLYRGPNGLMCAVGCLIPDSLYHEGLEEICAAATEVTSVLEDAGVLDQSEGEETYSRKVDLLAELQGVHDVHMSNSWDTAEGFLKEVSIKYGLTMSS